MASLHRGVALMGNPKLKRFYKARLDCHPSRDQVLTPGEYFEWSIDTDGSAKAKCEICKRNSKIVSVK